MPDLACLFVHDDAFLGFRAGEIVRVDLRRVTLYSESHIAYGNYGYLAGLLAAGIVQPLSEPDVNRLTGRPVPPTHLRRIA